MIMIVQPVPKALTICYKGSIGMMTSFSEASRVLLDI